MAMDAGAVVAIAMNVGTIIVGVVVSIFRLGKRVRQSQESEDKVKITEDKVKALETAIASINTRLASGDAVLTEVKDRLQIWSTQEELLSEVLQDLAGKRARIDGLETTTARLTKEVYDLNRDMGVALGKKR